jgi:protein-tyrosine phosphatase
MKILLVCLGNICRSPLAEGILQHKAQQAGLDWTIDSAGTNGYHTGEAPHHLSQKIAKANGIDISKQVSRRFTKEDIEKYDVIFAMAADVLQDIKRIAKEQFDEQKVKLFLNEMYPGENRDVPDPWYGEEDGYTDVYTILNETCEAIIKQHIQ